MTTTVEKFNAFELAGFAECSSPDSNDSAGAKFLLSVQDDLADRFENGQISGDDAHDEIHEVADNAPDVYTAKRWAEFVDLGAWQEDISELCPDAGADMEAAAGVALFMIAERLCNELIEKWSAAGDEEEEEEPTAMCRFCHSVGPCTCVVRA